MRMKRKAFRKLALLPNKSWLEATFRGQALLLGAWILTVLVATPALAADSSNTVWPTEATMMRYNPTHNAVWGQAVDSNINWTFMASDYDKPFTDLIAANGLIYFGSMDEQVYALDAVTGKKVWQFQANNWIMTDPVIADGKLFAGSGNRDFASKHIRGTAPNSVYALNAKTGQKLWEFSVEGEVMPTPVYRNGSLYFVTGDDAFYALNADTGELEYKIAVPSYFSMGSPAIDGNLVFAGGGNPYAMYAFNVATHKLQWQQTFYQVYQAMDDCSPAVDSNQVFTEGVTESAVNYSNPPPHDVLYDLNEQSGAVKWSFDMGAGYLIPDNKCGTPVVLNGVIYASSPVTNKFYALDEKTGKELWEYNIGAPSRGASAIIDNYVVFADLKGNVFALNRTNGKLIKKISLKGQISPDGPSIFNGTVYVANQDGHVYAFSLLKLIGSTLTKAQASTSTPNSQYYPETGHTISGDFLSYWKANGGLAQFGYPLTEPFYQFQASSGGTYLVQYFERARLEYHPEITTSPKIELGRLGVQLTANRTSEASFKALVSAPANSSGQFFSATGHSLSGEFLQYWQTHGGLAVYGYPISEPFSEVNPSDGKTYTVQYFERARFEYHPTNAGTSYVVELGQLGSQALVAAME